MSDDTSNGQSMSRREALSVIAAAGLATSIGCSKEPAHSSEIPPKLDTGSSHTTSPGTPLREVEMTNPIVNVSPLPQGQPWPTLEPFLFCVHHDDNYPHANDSMGPDSSLAGRNIGSDFGRKDGWSMYHGQKVPGFPRHPHRGFETVTVVRKGLVDHADSLGAKARYGRGDVQWLTAGDGINHAEMFPLLNREERNPIDFFQIWLNLPKKHKRVPPSFAMFWRDAIPKVTHGDTANRTTLLTLVAGHYGDTKAPAPPKYSWAADPQNDLAIWTLKLDPNAEFTIPKTAQGSKRALYLLRGSGIRIAGQAVPNMQLIELRPEQDATLINGESSSELLMLQARPIGEPIARHGPFVMNNREEIFEAYRDYQRTGFGGWPWPDDAPLHGPQDKRFAKHADGRFEEAT
jgi:redox-sensitive bicupin YhaK (pirin superfamily)